MGAGAFAEPLIVVVLLFGGAWVNRRSLPAHWTQSSPSSRFGHRESRDLEDGDPKEPMLSSREVSTSSSPSMSPERLSPWRTREVRLFKYSGSVVTPNTQVFSGRFLSRVLRRFPFLVEVLYWALIYWIYQLGRAFTAVTLSSATVSTARRHALNIIHVEKAFSIFIEIPIQKFFLQRPSLLHFINFVYSFIHIPGAIAFLVILYWRTVTRPLQLYVFEKQKVDLDSPGRRSLGQSPDNRSRGRKPSPGTPGTALETFDPALYARRRRTMALCNLLAFTIFTTWPCMPPRLLSDPNPTGPDANEARSYGFVDTVHSNGGGGSVWTTNKFCNQYAAMPSLHFGYSLLVGLTIATLPLSKPSGAVTISRRRWPSRARLLLVLFGIGYPGLILTAIISTGNHFVLDAVAGATVLGIAWRYERVLLNLCVLEDWMFWAMRAHKPDIELRQMD